MRILRPLILSILLIATTQAVAHDYAIGEVRIDHPWARATQPGADVGAGYFTLHNDGTEVERLTGGSSPVAERVEIHSMEIVDDVARMREMPGGIELPAGGEVAFAPGGYHLMLVGIEEPFVEGERVPLTLVFEGGGSVDVELAVEAGGPSAHDAHSGH